MLRVSRKKSLVARAPDLAPDRCDDDGHSSCNLGCQLVPDLEPLALDAEYDDVLREPSERPSHRHRLAEAEMMGGAAAELLGQLIVARIHPVNRAGWGSRRNRIDEPEGLGVRPGLDQAGRLTLPLEHLDAPRQDLPQTPGDHEPHGVVAAPGVSDANDLQLRWT